MKKQCEYEGCKKKVHTYKYICDRHAKELEVEPYGRFCEFCGIDTFNVKLHKKDCPVRK